MNKIIGYTNPNKRTIHANTRPNFPSGRNRPSHHQSKPVNVQIIPKKAAVIYNTITSIELKQLKNTLAKFLGFNI